ncbi:hypothetical protein B0H19DRAFT_1240562 [Mycena capillaripes]|nr:hypothetical protein B0H19DRAFT_1240562 [Mycena capillaripes]
MLFISLVYRALYKLSPRPVLLPANTSLSETNGQMNSVLGIAKEAIHPFPCFFPPSRVAHWRRRRDGHGVDAEQRQGGEAEQNAAQAKRMAEGAGDYVVGRTKNMMGALTGSTTQEASGKMQQASGQAKTDANKPM